MYRHADHPILTREDVPEVPGRVRNVSAVFNPGALRLGDDVLLLLRVQTRGRETVWMVAESRDGVRFDVRPHVVEIEGLDDLPGTVYHAYDARLTRIDDEILAVFAVDGDAGCHLAVARTTDLERFELVGLDATEEKRNGVLFPERWESHWWRLERPNRTSVEGSPWSGDTITLARSPDLEAWESVATIARGRPHYWDERIGSGPPAIRVAEGWLHLYHGIATHPASGDLYQAGVMLLDADDPTRLLARSRENVLEPRAMYEMVGQVPNVVFPTGWVVEDADSEGPVPADAPLLVYYGAADTCVGLARTTPAELLAACET